MMMMRNRRDGWLLGEMVIFDLKRTLNRIDYNNTTMAKQQWLTISTNNIKSKRQAAGLQQQISRADNVEGDQDDVCNNNNSIASTLILQTVGWFW